MLEEKKIIRIEAKFDTVEGGGVIVARGLPNKNIPIEEVDPFFALG